ncbi:hypothetical protein PSN45_002883 [Yamadazyma tenuis]|uniref:J domain-containing protein n=1 Tax=Candida tenuis (strain ATCC 10573 / BCRC 21748 / CBS 615 / JCM 9827 / NBRC 10315 / NRRL Y-1498 / VKM Y-70) TaxID=590646 RepID=G3AWE0_CANTC|nr:uncharacterized protein CANTEDRAFT_100980 [Yamadazyma tenuis ATCC 10573]EGV66520.1 hypothetical protein CANTEDRAFT_100980 [Yamadazyma tenuis ATCC 10573]WEJ95366.1 hypothetical protein PSN45_002883 [Yamadazyma tenuis]
MRIVFVIGFLMAFTSVLAVAAHWAPEDHEIFKLRDQVEDDLGKGATFYSWLNLKQGSKSTLEEISKAYRKKSRSLHPDKFHSAKKSVREIAEERFQRLSLVGNILRDQSLKTRYDYFLERGFPKWKGTGYYYSRFRPSMLVTVVFLYVVVGVFHFITLRISRQQDFKRVVQLKEQIKYGAWNGNLPPTDGSSIQVTSPTNGKEFVVYATGDVSMVETDDNGNTQLWRLDEHDIKTSVGFKDTLFFRFPVFLYNSSLGNVLGQIDTAEPASEHQDDKPKPKKKSNKNKGDKLELPNGKVIYGRKNLKKRK